MIDRLPARTVLRSVLRTAVRNSNRTLVSQMKAPLFSTELIRGVGELTLVPTGSNARRCLDNEGNWQLLKPEELGEYGSRRVENLLAFSEDFSQTGVDEWDTNTTMTVSTGVSDPSGGTTAATLTATGTTSVFGSALTGVSGHSYIESMWVRRRTGTGVVSFVVGDNVEQAITASLSANWQRFSAADITSSATLRCYVVLATSGDEVDIAFAQLEESTGRADTTTPSEYVSTGVGTGSELWTDLPDTIDSGWTDNGDDTYTCDGTNNANINQLVPAGDIGDGGTFLVEAEILVRNSGGMRLLVYGPDDVGIATNMNSVGVHREVIHIDTATATTTNAVIINSNVSFNGTVGNISVKRINHGVNVDGVQSFTYLDASTVNSNVVTEARGADIPASTLKGYFAEGAATNNALWSRDFTKASWVKTNITPVKNATGIDGRPSSASTLTATAGNGTAFQTVTIVSAAFNTSFWVKRKTGTGTIEITDNNGTNYTDITSLINPSTFTLVEINRTQANPVFGFRIVTSADAIEVDFAGLVDNPTSTSPIETDGSTKTRPDSTKATLDLANFSDSEGSMEFELTPFFNVATGAEQGLVTPNSGSSTLIRILSTPAKSLRMSDETTATSFNNAWSTPGQTITVKLIWSTVTGKMSFSVDGAAATEVTFDGSFGPSGALTLFKSLTLGAAMKNLKTYKRDKGNLWLSLDF